MYLKIKINKNLLYIQQDSLLNKKKYVIKSQSQIRIVSKRKRCKAYSEDSGPQMESLDMASKGGLAGTSEGVFGPLAILLIGFQEHEYEAFKNILIDMEATMIHLIPCNSQMLKGTLKEAFESAFDNNMPLNMKYEILPIGIKRTIILSGMYASEVSQIVSAYKEAKMARAVFAAAIPNNWDHNLLELVEEVYDDHKFMMQKKLES